MFAKRIWKRDGSVNVMRIHVAADNLRSYCTDEAVRKMPRTAIADKLLLGVEFETKHAVFKLA
jgi:hypothetical protein